MRRAERPLPHSWPGWPGGPPTIIVLHYSGGYTERNLYDTLDARGLSAHYGVGRDGLAVEYVDPHLARAWHAGGSTWAGSADLNQCSLGIELVGFGAVEGIGSTRQRPAAQLFDPATSGLVELNAGPEVYWRNETYGTSSTTVLTRQGCDFFPEWRPDLMGKRWSTYPPAQVAAVFELVWTWVERYRILPEYIIGHEHGSPGRKIDPGPAFPWSQLERYIDERLPTSSVPELASPRYCELERVKALQSHCARLGSSPGWIDGIWGPRTERACLNVQVRFVGLYANSRTGERLEGLEMAPEHVTDICRVFRLIPALERGRR